MGRDPLPIVNIISVFVDSADKNAKVTATVV
jgi:hypothetical protein